MHTYDIELTHYGYDGGTNYTKADKVFRPYGGGRVMFVTFRDA